MTRTFKRISAIGVCLAFCLAYAFLEKNEAARSFLGRGVPSDMARTASRERESLGGCSSRSSGCDLGLMSDRTEAPSKEHIHLEKEGQLVAGKTWSGEDTLSQSDEVVLALTKKQLTEMQDLVDEGRLDEVGRRLGLRQPNARRNVLDNDAEEVNRPEDSELAQTELGETSSTDVFHNEESASRLEQLAQVVGVDLSQMTKEELAKSVRMLKQGQIARLAQELAVDVGSLSPEQIAVVAELTGIKSEAIKGAMKSINPNSAIPPNMDQSEMIRPRDVYAQMRARTDDESSRAQARAQASRSYVENAARSRRLAGVE